MTEMIVGIWLIGAVVVSVGWYSIAKDPHGPDEHKAAIAAMMWPVILAMLLFLAPMLIGSAIGFLVRRK